MNSANSEAAPPAGHRPSIAAVVVTFNRLALLQECVAALRSQTRPPDAIFVVNNGSTDGTGEWLAGQTDLTVVTQGNLGSAGGQHTGIKSAYDRGHDWFWCMDDDTIPYFDALERLIGSPHFAEERTGHLSSVVLWTDGTPHKLNQQEHRHPSIWVHRVLDSDSIPVRIATFVSILIHRRVVSAVGLPIREFFIWYDDCEFTIRASDQFNGYVVLRSYAVHKTPTNEALSTTSVPTALAVKYCYGLRNRIYMLRTGRLPRYIRFREIESLIRRHLVMVLLGRAPAKVLTWCMRGLLFSPKIERV